MSDHEMVRFGDRLIPILGVVNGTREQNMETARNIEAFMKRVVAAQRAADRFLTNNLPASALLEGPEWSEHAAQQGRDVSGPQERSGCDDQNLTNPCEFIEPASPAVDLGSRAAAPAQPEVGGRRAEVGKTGTGSRPRALNSTVFINRAAVRDFLLETADGTRAHKFTRVSEETLRMVNESVRSVCLGIVRRLPSKGKTI